MKQELVLELPKRLSWKQRRKEWAREYYKRPDVIAKRRTPEAIARKAEYDKEYRRKKNVLSNRRA